MHDSRTAAPDRHDALLPATPKVSVCMITYNHGRFVGQAIESALAQRTSFDVEIVIGDDCSQDATRDIVVDYQRRYPAKIRAVLPTSNLGPRGNFLQTLAACRGQYVAFLEGDDYWTDPEKLQLQADMMDREPSAFLCGARVQVWRDGEAGPSTLGPPQDSSLLATWGARELVEGRWWFWTCTKMMPTELVRSIPHEFGFDWAALLWMIARTNFGKVCFLDRVVGVYREHAGGIWSSRTRAERAVMDAETLFRVIPLFEGADRQRFERRLRESVEILLREDGAGRYDPLRCAAMAAVRSPRSPGAWRNLAAGLRRVIVSGAPAAK